MKLIDAVKNIHLDKKGIPTNAAALVETLRILVAYDTSSSHDAKKCRSNAAMITDLAATLKELGGDILTIEEEKPELVAQYGEQKTLLVRFGPKKAGGIVLCAHTDVVPVIEEQWQTKPFELQKRNGKLFGRGTSDMKGAIANYLSIAASLINRELTHPIYFLFTWGEEIGCKGSFVAAQALNKISAKPDLIIVGEPTDEKLIVGHKGASTLSIGFRGISGHSGYPENGINSIQMAAEFVAFITKLQQNFQLDRQYHDMDFDPPYPIVNVGTISGGIAGNVIPEYTEITLHVRPLPIANFLETHIITPIQKKINELNNKMELKRAQIQKTMKINHLAEVGIELKQTSLSSGLASQKDDGRLKEFLAQYKSKLALNDLSHLIKTAAYSTDAGGIVQGLQDKEKPLVIINGPGAMSQNAHAADEWITEQQLVNGIAFPYFAINKICLEKPCPSNNPA